MNHLLCEFKDYNASNIVLEASTNALGQKELYMKGIFLQADIKNQNQRVYPLHEIQSAVEKIRQKIQKGESILGERDHPSDLNINLDRVSHVIVDMWMEGNNGMGKLKILPTMPGDTIRQLLESGIKLGVSSRGSGDVDYNGMVRDFEIITVDIVAQPSAPQAFPKAIYESMYSLHGTKIAERMNTHKTRAEMSLAEAKKCAEFIRSLKV
jgi:Prohead core protein serine protease